MTTFKALEPTTLGSLTLANRIVMAPMTHSRTLGSVPHGMIAEFYRQRATAGLIVTEGAAVAPERLGDRTPGLFDLAQVAWWGHVTAAVHWRRGNIFAQLMHAGPTLTAPDVNRARDAFVRSAILAMRAGFDGVELNGSSAYSLDVAQDVADAIGADRVGVRLPPWSDNADVGRDPMTYTHLAAELQKIGVVYLHLIAQSNVREPGMWSETLRSIRRVFTSSLILDGGFETVAGIETAIAGGDADLVSVGRSFVANPDLVDRLKRGLPLNHADDPEWFTPDASAPAEELIDYSTAA